MVNKEVTGLIFGGVLSLVLLFQMSPTLANSFGAAVEAFQNVTGLSSAQSDTIVGILILILIVFFFVIAYALYLAVESMFE